MLRTVTLISATFAFALIPAPIQAQQPEANTAAAVRALSEGLRIDLLGTGVRVSSVDPGMVDTEFSEVRFHGNRERAAGVYRGMIPLAAEDVANVVTFVATRPPHVGLAEVLVMPTDQASAHHVHRRKPGDDD